MRSAFYKADFLTPTQIRIIHLDFTISLRCDPVVNVVSGAWHNITSIRLNKNTKQFSYDMNNTNISFV